MYTISFVPGSTGSANSVPAGYAADSSRTPDDSGIDNTVGIRNSSLGACELMCNPCLMRKCSATGVAFPRNRHLLGIKILNGFGLCARSPAFAVS